ncbi:MAG: domain containing protein, partial [Pseudonocardiales bacterium]|nr:domain containing protein [Pseudonocardiales bacterium]
PGGRPLEHVRGAALGLPPTGPGSLATFGRRAGAFAIDSLLSALVASLFVSADPELPGVASRLPGWWSLIPLSVLYIGGMLLVGKTLGQHLLGLRIVRVDKVAAVNPWRAIVRTALLVLLIPAVIVDKDGRGMHDRLTDTAVING